MIAGYSIMAANLVCKTERLCDDSERGSAEKRTDTAAATGVPGAVALELVAGVSWANRGLRKRRPSPVFSRVIPAARRELLSHGPGLESEDPGGRWLPRAGHDWNVARGSPLATLDDYLRTFTTLAGESVVGRGPTTGRPGREDRVHPRVLPLPRSGLHTPAVPSSRWTRKVTACHVGPRDDDKTIYALPLDWLYPGPS
jgi:hypothetical protein